MGAARRRLSRLSTSDPIGAVSPDNGCRNRVVGQGHTGILFDQLGRSRTRLRITVRQLSPLTLRDLYRARIRPASSAPAHGQS